MQYVAYVPLFSAILTAFIGVYVLLLNRKKVTNIVFSTLVIFISIFCIGEFMTRVSETPEFALFFGRFCYSAVIFISCLAVHFSLVFPRKYPNNTNILSRYGSSLHILYAISVTLVVTLNIMISFQDVLVSKWGYRVILSPSTRFVIYWLLLCSLLAAFNLIHTYFKKHITINEKKQIQFVTVGLLIVVAISLGTNLIPPLFGAAIFPMTTISLVIFSFIVAYSIKKYDLMKLTNIETADAVVDTMTDALVVIDENNTIVNVNSPILSLLGYKQQELQNASLRHIVDFPIFKKNILSTVLKTGKIENVEVEFFAKDKTTVPMNVSASSICDKNGKLEGIVIVARDLTETKNFICQLEEAKTSLEKRVKERTKDLLQINVALEREISERQQKEKELQESEEKYRTLIEGSADGILIVQGNTIKFVNSAMLTIFDCQQTSDVVGHHFTEFIAPDYQQMMIKRGSAREQGMAVENRYEFKALHKDNTPFDAELSVSVIEYEGKPARQGIVKDITAKKKSLEELQEAHEMLKVMNKELERKVEERTGQVKALLKQKDEFIHQLGHDLKNPLTPLVTLLPIIKKRQNDPKSEELIEVTIQNVHYMRDLVGKTLELARLNAPSTMFDIEDTNLSERASNVIKAQQLMFKENDIIIENNINKDIIVKADTLRLDELFNNLLTNAVKYSPKGGTITLCAKKEKNVTTILVKDTGIGMTKEQVDRIFDEFYMVDESRHDMDSSGLGLAICKRVVEKHGGKIWAESQGPKKGSTFYFTLKTSK